MNLQSKQDYQKAMLDLLQPLKNRFSEGYARIKLEGAGACYNQDAVEMEAFARPLWALVPYWAGGGRDDGFLEKYQQGIVAGTTPSHPEYWGVCSDIDQKFVEMTPIALGLLMVPHLLWEPLEEKDKSNLALYLYEINNFQLPKCNWYFFRILVNIALQKLGRNYNADLLKSDLEYIESCYLGEGWFVDGQSQQKDYYSAFAMQFYSLIYCKYTQDNVKCSTIKSNAQDFAKDFIYWFDSTGAALPFGRSLTYRFAQASFWSAAVFSDAIQADLGEVKGIINRNIDYWLSKNIFQGDGTLSIGYAYSNLSMAERYNATGSPYWCCKAFLLLALPDEHSFWQILPKPLPKLKAVHCVTKADMLLQHNGNEVTAYVPGYYTENTLGHFVEKYAKFAYSTGFAFSVAHSQYQLCENAPDSMLAFEIDSTIYVRKRSISYEIFENEIISIWSPYNGIVVETSISVTNKEQVRRHTIKSNIASKVYDCGFAISWTHPNYSEESTDTTIKVSNNFQSCIMTSMTKNTKPYIIDAVPNTNLLYENTKIPTLMCQLPIGQTIIITKINAEIKVEE